jgi:6-bladed beta-propeller
MSPTSLVRRALPAAAALALVTAPAAAQQVVRLPERDQPLAGRPTALFSIGAEEGRSWEMLSSAEQAAFDRADNLYVLDRGNARVLVFDPRGRFVRQIGKKGGGPGEFEVPISLAILSDGTLAVMDIAHRNVSLFGPDGAFRRTLPWEDAWGMPGREVAPHPGGGMVALLRPILRPDAPAAGRGATRTQSLARIPAAAGGRSVKLLDFPDRSQASSSSSTPGQVNFRVLPPPEFSPLTLWGVLPDGGIAFSNTSLYTVDVTDASGRVTRRLQRPVRVRRATERDREQARARIREQMQSGRGMINITRGGPGGGRPPRQGLSREQIEQRVRELQFADTVRTLQGLVVAPSGKIWVERTPAVVGEPGPIDVITPAGRYLGTIAGQPMPVAISRTGRAAYLERDELDVERVVVRQLPAAWWQ